MKKPILIIFTGLPGTGKTTLSRQLSEALNIPLVAKDAIKEIMYDHIGWSDRAFSAKLAHATFGIMDYVATQQLQSGNTLILESNYSPRLANEHFQNWQNDYDCKIIQIVCRTNLDVLVSRYLERNRTSERHPGHIDNEGSLESYKNDFGRRIENDEDQPLAVQGPVRIVDTTDFGSIHKKEIAEWVKNNL
jgi:predicted kinase